jgi:hypothetical protein
MLKNRGSFIGILLAFTVLLFVLFQLESRDTRDWTETYLFDSFEPYGSSVLYHLLENKARLNRLDTLISEVLPVDSTGNSNYFFLGESLLLDSISLDTLLRFVELGNTAFIAARSVPYDLMREIHPRVPCKGAFWDDFYTSWEENAQLWINPSGKDTLSLFFVEENEKQPYHWQYIDTFFICDSLDGFSALGYLNHSSQVSFARLHHGKGTFYFHTVPLAFTNASLLRRAGKEYISKTLSFLHEGPIFWDNVSQIEELISRSRNADAAGNGPGMPRENPLQYILSQEALSWAWYLTLFLVFLYVLFQAKRRQRIIPVLPPNQNISLEFVFSVGKLYFLQNNHKKLILQNMRLFLSFIRNRYHIPISETPETLQLKKLELASEIPTEKAVRIFDLFKAIKSSKQVSDKTLTHFYQALQEFYQNAR